MVVVPSCVRLPRANLWREYKIPSVKTYQDMCWPVNVTVLRNWVEIQYGKNAFKLKEIKTDASFFDETFVSTLNSIFAIYIAGWRGWKRTETLNCKRFSLDVIYSKIPKILKWIAFPFDIVLFPFKECVAFESSTKIRFWTSYDPKPAQLSWRCPLTEPWFVSHDNYYLFQRLS